MALSILLRQACPAGLRVLPAPFAVRPDEFNEVQPDVLVARYGDLTEDDLPRAPVLAVEVISPTSRLRDAHLKKAVYARLGSPSFWLVDPARAKPPLTAFELAGGAYREVACVAGDEAWTATRPFPVRVVPADLVRRLGATRRWFRTPGATRRWFRNPGRHPPLARHRRSRPGPLIGCRCAPPL